MLTYLASFLMIKDNLILSFSFLNERYMNKQMLEHVSNFNTLITNKLIIIIIIIIIKSQMQIMPSLRLNTMGDSPYKAALSLICVHVTGPTFVIDPHLILQAHAMVGVCIRGFHCRSLHYVT